MALKMLLYGYEAVKLKVALYLPIVALPFPVTNCIYSIAIIVNMSHYVVCPNPQEK